MSLVLLLSVPSPVQARPISGPTSGPTSGPSSAATAQSVRAARALADVQALFEPTARQVARRTQGGSRVDATLALRRLVLEQRFLSPAQRRLARAYLARPTGSRVFCNATVCVHWNQGLLATDAPDLTDADGSGVPDYVELVAATVTHVHQTYVRAGLRAPERDGSAGGSSLPDIYLEDLGSQGIYGYCTTDQEVPARGPYDAPAYCSLDNDYAEFPTNTPTENLQVTAAHEYFHAVQFAYDVAEDPWLLEASATWAEDELYDDVDDNLQYLPASPLAKPQASMDEFEGARPYGDWIYFRYLTERYPATSGSLPVLMRRLFELLDGAKGGPNLYSTQALARLLRRDHHADFARVFAQFAAANRRPGVSYSEGRANDYPVAPLREAVRLGARHRSSGWGGVRLDHLSAATVRFTPGAGVRADSWHLRLRLDLPDVVRGSAAVVTVKTRRSTTSQTITLTKRGTADLRTDFGSRKVSWVEVTLANGSRRFACAQATLFSCAGQPRDDAQRFGLRATVVRSRR